MKFKFENLGPIYKGEIELTDLTVLCGKNNTGKTYITNTIYAFLKDWKEIIDWKLTKEIEDSLVQRGVVQVDLKTEIIDKINDHISNSMSAFQKKIPEYFATSSEIFENSKINFFLEIDDTWLNVDYDGEIKK